MAIAQLFPRIRQQRVADIDLIVFSRKMDSMIRTGMSPRQALAVISQDGSNAQISNALKEVIASVDKGAMLSTALGEHPSIFPPLYTSLVLAGEQSGSCSSFGEAADLLHKNALLRQTTKQAVVYPASIVAGSAAVAGFALGVAWKALKR